jgi:hypothetical protein
MDAPHTPRATLEPRAVPLTAPFAWFEAALRVFKRAPWCWCALGSITLASDLLLELVPGIGVAAAKVVVPVIECGMLLGAAVVDRGGALEIRFAVAAFKAPPAALAAIVIAALFVSGVEALAAYSLTGTNLLTDPADARITPFALLLIVGAATAASLPLVFVPMAVLFQRAGFGRAFALSAQAFALNVAPLLLFGVLSLLLTVIGLLAFGVGLIGVLPLLAIASYAAWKDIYGVVTALTPS